MFDTTLKVVSGNDVHARLAELDLSDEILRHVVQAGIVARGACTPNDPRSAPGLQSWIAIVRTMSDDLVPQGWTRVEDDNLPLVVHPHGEFAIGTATGDADTGLSHGSPKTQLAKGPAWRAGMLLNKQLVLTNVDTGAPAFSTSLLRPRLLLVLLVYHDSQEVRFELSLPRDADEYGRISSWAPRIVLAPIRLNPIDTEPQRGRRIDFDITRKKT